MSFCSCSLYAPVGGVLFVPRSRPSIQLMHGQPTPQGESGTHSCRLEAVCWRCAVPCGDAGAHVANDNMVPQCEPAPEHTTCSEGSAVAGLNLDAGYYRSSSSSTNILECHRRLSCEGGLWGEEQDNQCARGYVGPCESV